ncbi:hypothetical protein VTI74DRAFT_3945 [Chaetomium olivicolor]
MSLPEPASTPPTPESVTSSWFVKANDGPLFGINLADGCTSPSVEIRLSRTRLQACDEGRALAEFHTVSSQRWRRSRRYLALTGGSCMESGRRHVCLLPLAQPGRDEGRIKDSDISMRPASRKGVSSESILPCVSGAKALCLSIYLSGQTSIPPCP